MNNALLNIHIYPTYFTNESRILREANAIIDFKLADKVVLIGIWKKGLPVEEAVSDHIKILRIRTTFEKAVKLKWLNLLSFAVFYFRVFFLSVKLKPSIVNAHSLTVLPLCTFIKWMNRTKLIYDAHELETETNDSHGIRKIVAKLVERLFIQFSDYVIVVSESIRKWYAQSYSIPEIEVIRNIPTLVRTREKNNILRKKLNLDTHALIFIYVGVLTRGRGIELMLNTFKNEKTDKHLVLLGYGPLAEEVKSFQSTNIHYLDSVEPEVVVEHVSGADVGISLIEGTCLSYFYCLPNKVFEYIAGGIPFFCSSFPDLQHEFGDKDIAWFIKDDMDFGNVLTTLNKAEIERKRSNIIKHQQVWQWQLERGKYKDIYHSIKQY